MTEMTFSVFFVGLYVLYEPFWNFVGKYDFSFSVYLFVYFGISINIFRVLWNWCMLFMYTILMFCIEMMNVAFAVLLQGNTKNSDALYFMEMD